MAGDLEAARRLARALVEELHDEHGDALEAAAREGALADRFAEAIAAARATHAKRAGAVPGADPFGEALQALAGRWGDPGQVALEPAADEPAPEAEAAGTPEPEPAPAAGQAAGKAGSPAAHAGGDDEAAATIARLRAALREATRRVRELEAENRALHEELLSAGEMIESLALDLERPVE